MHKIVAQHKCLIAVTSCNLSEIYESFFMYTSLVYSAIMILINGKDVKNPENPTIINTTQLISALTTDFMILNLLENPINGGKPINERQDIVQIKALTGIKYAMPFKSLNVYVRYTLYMIPILKNVQILANECDTM